MSTDKFSQTNRDLSRAMEEGLSSPCFYVLTPCNLSFVKFVADV